MCSSDLHFEPGGDRTLEVKVGQELLQTMGFRTFVPLVAACPGCGRTTSTTFQELAGSIQKFIHTSMPEWKTRYPGVENLNVAVMGCADDFIRKPFSQRLLVERVKSVLRRSIPKDPTAAPPKEADIKALERGQLRMDPERHTCTWKGEPVTLTVTEFLILQALAARSGVVKSRNALMDAAYDDQVYVDDRTIDSHIKRLRKKFKQVDDDFDVIETLYGVGYRFKEQA